MFIFIKTILERLFQSEYLQVLVGSEIGAFVILMGDRLIKPSSQQNDGWLIVLYVVLAVAVFVTCIFSFGEFVKRRVAHSKYKKI